MALHLKSSISFHLCSQWSPCFQLYTQTDPLFIFSSLEDLAVGEKNKCLWTHKFSFDKRHIALVSIIFEVYWLHLEQNYWLMAPFIVSFFIWWQKWMVHCFQMQVIHKSWFPTVVWNQTETVSFCNSLFLATFSFFHCLVAKTWRTAV